MNLTTRIATEADEGQLNLISKLSPFTRDFSNPPLSLKATRKVAIPQGEVILAEDNLWKGGVLTKVIVGFVWSRPMKAKHMNFSTIYYIGVVPAAQKYGAATSLVNHALTIAKNGTIEAVTEDSNAASMAFFRDACRAEFVRKGVVGKDNRPYTRWRIDNAPN